MKIQEKERAEKARSLGIRGLHSVRSEMFIGREETRHGTPLAVQCFQRLNRWSDVRRHMNFG